MELEHSFTVPVPRERAWEVLLDVEKVAPCMPGASLDSVDGDEIKGRIKVKVGPISMTYAGTARFTERDAAAGVVTLEASGKETRGAGTASASVRSVLEDQGDETRVTVHTNLNVTGKPAQFGRGVMTEVGGKLIGIFATNLAAMLAAEQGDPATEGGTDQDTAEGAAAEAGSGAAAEAGSGAAAEGAPSQSTAAAEDASDSKAQAELALPLEDLNLPMRSYNSLRRDGVHTVGELAARTPAELLAVEGIGPASVEEIRRKLAERGLGLGESPASANGVASTGAGVSAATGAGTTGAGVSGVTGVTRTPVPAAAAATSASTAPARPAAIEMDDDAINLVSVAGLPVLKRAAPALAGLAVAAVIVIRVRSRRRRRLG
jgi:carbon monoxide dehydrogenase subunit G